jgi:hypothetical protein
MIDKAKSKVDNYPLERTTERGPLNTLAARVTRTLTAALDAAESEPLRVVDPDDPDAEGDP